MSTLEDLVNYRMARAKETLQEAQTLGNSALWNGAINRLYYACFYMVDALLIVRKISHKTHAGTKHQLNLHFGKTKEIEAEMLKFYNDLFEDRFESDYGEFSDFNEDDFQDLFPQAQGFIQLIETKITNA
jgi:uncharacterized protein (UPF0332 family)